MKLNGHYWCDRCDEPAFGAACQHCHQSARFIPDEPKLPTERTKPVRVAVSLEQGHQLFAAMRQKLNLL